MLGDEVKLICGSVAGPVTLSVTVASDVWVVAAKSTIGTRLPEKVSVPW